MDSPRFEGAGKRESSGLVQKLYIRVVPIPKAPIAPPRVPGTPPGVPGTPHVPGAPPVFPGGPKGSGGQGKNGKKKDEKDLEGDDGGSSRESTSAFVSPSSSSLPSRGSSISAAPGTLQTAGGLNTIGIIWLVICLLRML
jgi:hypothetical protein